MVRAVQWRFRRPFSGSLEYKVPPHWTEFGQPRRAQWKVSKGREGN